MDIFHRFLTGFVVLIMIFSPLVTADEGGIPNVNASENAVGGPDNRGPEGPGGGPGPDPGPINNPGPSDPGPINNPGPIDPGPVFNPGVTPPVNTPVIQPPTINLPSTPTLPQTPTLPEPGGQTGPSSGSFTAPSTTVGSVPIEPKPSFEAKAVSSQPKSSRPSFSKAAEQFQGASRVSAPGRSIAGGQRCAKGFRINSNRSQFSQKPMRVSMASSSMYMDAGLCND